MTAPAVEVVGLRPGYWARECGAPLESVIMDADRLAATGADPCESARYWSSGYDTGASAFGPDVGGGTLVREAATGRVLALYSAGEPASWAHQPFCERTGTDPGHDPARTWHAVYLPGADGEPGRYVLTEPGRLITGSDGHNGARVVLLARDRGWDGRDAEEPAADIAALAERELGGGTLSADEDDLLSFRWPLDAEQWLNDHAAADGYTFGWHDGEFFYQPAAWWQRRGGPDQMFL